MCLDQLMPSLLSQDHLLRLCWVLITDPGLRSQSAIPVAQELDEEVGHEHITAL